jgi:hypothetical protein
MGGKEGDGRKRGRWEEKREIGGKEGDERKRGR